MRSCQNGSDGHDLESKSYLWDAPWLKYIIVNFKPQSSINIKFASAVLILSPEINPIDIQELGGIVRRRSESSIVCGAADVTLNAATGVFNDPSIEIFVVEYSAALA